MPIISGRNNFLKTRLMFRKNRKWSHSMLRPTGQRGPTLGVQDMQRNLKTVQQFAADSPFTEAQLRWWIFNATSNGLRSTIVRIGRRVYIDVDAFARWIDSLQVAT